MRRIKNEVFDGKELVAEIQTYSDPVALTLDSDKSTLMADAYDVAHLVVQLTDEKGIPVLTENTKISFELEGDARILGVDNRAPENTQDFQSNRIVTDQGRCLLILQSNLNPGTVKVTASANGL
jgi:beta-galactosidase